MAKYSEKAIQLSEKLGIAPRFIEAALNKTLPGGSIEAQAAAGWRDQARRIGVDPDDYALRRYNIIRDSLSLPPVESLPPEFGD